MPQKKNSLNNRLPYGWKPKVQQILAGKGVQLELYQINDIYRGKNSDGTLTKEVFQALRKVIREVERKRSLAAKLKSTI